MTGMTSRPTAFDAALPEFPTVAGGMAPRRRRRPSAFDAALPDGEEVTAALGRGEQVNDQYTSDVIQGGGYVGTRPQTAMELEAKKNRRRLGLDGSNPWTRAGVFQGRGTL